MLDNEIAPITFSLVGDVSFSLMDLVPSLTLHSDHPHMSHSIDFGVFGDEQMKRHVMMDDVFLYHAKTEPMDFVLDRLTVGILQTRVYTLFF